jgi:hypothetical protein
MPPKLSPGTPSIGEGVRTPCQWIELGSLKRLVTARVKQPGFETLVALAKYVDLSRGKVRPKRSTGVA